MAAPTRASLFLKNRLVVSVSDEALVAIDTAARRKMISTSAWIRALISDRLQLDEQQAREPVVRERRGEPAVADAV